MLNHNLVRGTIVVLASLKYSLLGVWLMAQKLEFKEGAILEHKDTIVETLRNYEMDGKALKDVAEKSYFNHLVEAMMKEVIQDQTLIDDALEMVREKLINNDNDAFKLRVLKLVKPELVSMFKEDLSALMGNKKVVLDDYMPPEKEDTAKEESD